MDDGRNPIAYLTRQSRIDSLVGALGADEDAFWANVDASGDCWEWIGQGNGQANYGLFGFTHPATGKRVRAVSHRVAWRLLVGEIPPGSQLDHLCFNTRCVNPDHLEAVTPGENVRRNRFDGPKRNALKTHCPRGHPYEGKNLRIREQSEDSGWGVMRYCKTCHRARERDRYRKANNVPKEKWTA